MQKTWAVYTRELGSYFSSQIIYVIAAVFIIIVGNMFKNAFFQFADESMRLLRMTWQFGSQNVNLININGVALGVFSYINLMLLLITPLLTMRLYAEEKRNGTMELLTTSPITTTQVLLGKYLSCLTIYTLLTGLTAVFMLLLGFYSEVEFVGLPFLESLKIIPTFTQLDMGPIILSYIGTFMLGVAIIPIGMFFSSLTENQIVAAFTSLSVLLVLWILLRTALQFSYPWNEIIAYISLSEHQNLLKLGFFGIKHVVFYMTVSLFWLVLTWMSVESARWRQ